MRLSRSVKIVSAAFCGALVAGAVVAVTALAASPTPARTASPKSETGQASAACDSFLGKVAKNLGKSSAQVKKALTDATGQTIDEQVKAGALTKAQGDQMKQKLGAAQACSGALAGIHRPALEGRAAEGIVTAAVPKALGLAPDELKKELAAGQTLQQIASAKGMDEAAFRTKLIATAKPDLDQAVTAKKITQAQADAAIQRLQKNPIPMWTRGGPHRARPAAVPTPATST